MAGQIWSTDTLGGYLYSDELSTILRTAMQPMFRFQNYCDARDGTQKKLNSGDKFYWDATTKVVTKGKVLAEQDLVQETNFTISQKSLTLVQAANSVPYTSLLDNYSKIPITNIIHQTLADDANDVQEDQAYAQFDATPLRVTPTSGTSPDSITLETGGSATATNNVAMSNEHVKAILDEMKERDIPTYDGVDYRCIGRPKTFRPFKNDLEGIHHYVETGFGMVLRGEVGKHYDGCRFVEQTGIANAGWTNAKSDEAFFFGKDTVINAVVIPVEIRGKIPGNFGLDKGFAWYWLGGYGLVHTIASQARVVKWDSAA